MKVSLNTVKQFTNVDLPVDELVVKINQQLGGVEEVIDLGAKYKQARIVRVVECQKHPNADRLNVCKIDVGNSPLYSKFYIPNSTLIEVVCGAPNVHADMWAVWLPPESIVPDSFDDDEPFVLGARELRGVMSNGMLASARELALGDDHDGIVELTENDLKQAGQLEAGASFAETFGLNDTIIDIENKMFTHRPDLFGQLGVAREIAGIQHKPFKSPDWYVNQPVFETAEDLELEVYNDASDKVPRFMAVAIKNVTVEPSPMWLKCALVAMGSKPINNIVDATNYVMLITAQPTHAYDYDKLRGAKLGARMAVDGENVELLNGKTYQLNSNDIVIADGEGVVGLGGIMGGNGSEVSKETKNIVLEVANFDMYAVRKSSMRHGLFTDALTRFNKGQSPLQNPVVLGLLSDMMVKTGASQASLVFDEGPTVSANKEVSVTSEFINQRLGLELSDDEVRQLIEAVEIKTSGSGDLQVQPPFWRTDIELKEDIVEEVGRLYGFDKLPRELPQRSTKPAPNNQDRLTAESIRSSFARSGANEVLTYSFVHENVIKKSEQDIEQAFKLSNALSPDLQYYRLSVLPSLLDKVHMNIKAGHDEFMLFEIGKGHNKLHHLDDDDGLPGEMKFVDAVYASKHEKDGAAFYRMRRMAEQLASDLGFELVYKVIEQPLDYPVTAPFELKRSALVETKQGEFIGMIGELKQSVVTKFKLPKYVSAATLDFDGISRARQTAKQSYQPLSRYPSVTQDLSLKVPVETDYSKLESLVSSAIAEKASGMSVEIDPLAIYQSGRDTESKTISFRISVTSFDKTLTDDDVKTLLDNASSKAGEAVDAVVS